MSKQPANPKDLEELTEYWHRETNYVNEKVDDAFKAAQDHAYALGLKRGDEERSRLHAANAELVEALSDLLVRDERNTCQHDETHRGGAIWEICDACGAQWADDMGGKPEWKDPVEWDKARAALSKHKEQA